MVQTECGHVTYPSALSVLGSMTTECHKCGKVVKVVAKATRKQLYEQILGVEFLPLPDMPPF